MTMFHIIYDVITGETKEVPFTEEELTAYERESYERELASLRLHRDELLKETDFAVLPDNWERMSDQTRKEWSDYRQALRDLPESADPKNVIWPAAPGGWAPKPKTKNSE